MKVQVSNVLVPVSIVKVTLSNVIDLVPLSNMTVPLSNMIVPLPNVYVTLSNVIVPLSNMKVTVSNVIAQLSYLLAQATRLFGNIYHLSPLCSPAQKQVSIIRKYHNHTPQTNPQHREEELQYTNYHKTSGRHLKNCIYKDSYKH